MHPLFKPMFLTGSFLLAQAPLAGETIYVGRFSQNELSHWQTKSFADPTHYVLREENDKTILVANSNNSASGLFQEITIDLKRTPFLNWYWQVIDPLPSLPEQTKAGDDYAARIYLIKQGGIFFWQTKALNFVWSSGQAKETLWPNAFAGKNVMMLAVRNNDDQGWHCEKRDLRADWQRAFGEATNKLDAVALMTDSDNSKGQAAAYYGDIWFSSN